MENVISKRSFWALLILVCGLSSLSAQAWVNELPIPYQIQSDTVLLRMDVWQHNFNPQGTGQLNAPVTAYGFNSWDFNGGQDTMTYLGPSVSWSYLHNVHTEVWNNLPVTSTCHWHGAHVPPHCDGGPHQRIPPSDIWDIDFEVLDKSATMWYHPHFMDHTYEQVQMGITGLLYVEDPVDGASTDDSLLNAIHNMLPHTYGVDDFPIIPQTKHFLVNNNVVSIDTGGYKYPNQRFDFVVNGVLAPTKEVPQQIVRLRVLNGDSKFSFAMGLADSTLAFGSMPFQLIATDAGYTTQSFELDQVLMGPGERTEWLVDLRNVPIGTKFYMMNFTSEIPSGVIGDPQNGGYPNDTSLVQFVVKAPDVVTSTITSFPISLAPLEIPATNVHTKRRTKTFTQSKYTINWDTGQPVPDTLANSTYQINGELMSMRHVNDTIMLDSTEIWSVDNNTNVAHPFHIHDIHFYVTKVYTDSARTDSLDPNDPAYAYLFQGPLDNVLVLPDWQLEFVGTFKTYGGEISPDSGYMYHCHILPHEDRGMMGQFVVWDKVNFPLAVNEIVSNDGSIRLYPNPSEGELYLEGESRKASHVRFIDLQGRVLREQSLPAFSGSTRLNVNGLGHGLIFVEWTSPQGILTGKVLLR